MGKESGSASPLPQHWPHLESVLSLDAWVSTPQNSDFLGLWPEQQELSKLPR